MEPCKIDIKGPAHLIVTISENEYDRWAFNDLVDHIFGHNIATQDELQTILKKWDDFHDCMMTHFREELLGTDREELRAFHKRVIKRMEKPK